MRVFTSWLVWVVVCLGAGIKTGRAATLETYPTQPGIWLEQTPKRHCDADCQQQLLESLRRITGLQQLQFSRAGALQVADGTALMGGSASARAVLFRALNSGQVYLIEAHPSSPDVSFGQLDAGLIYEVPAENLRLTIWRVRLDLVDFRRITAPAPVLAAFDVGFAFLHEVLHGLGYEDTDELHEVGPCEEVVNQMRTELGLPLRAQYLGHALKITAQVLTVRLAFHDAPLPEPRSGKRPKRRTYQLFFAPEIGQHPQILKETTAKSFLRRR